MLICEVLAILYSDCSFHVVYPLGIRFLVIGDFEGLTEFLKVLFLNLPVCCILPIFFFTYVIEISYQSDDSINRLMLLLLPQTKQ